MRNVNQLEGPHRLDVGLGHRVRERRRALGVTQQELAAAIGVTFQQVQKYERGSNRISFSKLALVAQALKCRLGDLADGLDAGRPALEVEHVNDLTRVDGALDLLEAFVALPTPRLRLVLIHHARELGRALSSMEPAAQVRPKRSLGAASEDPPDA